MKKTILLLFIVLISFTKGFSQEFPVGKWEFDSISNEGLSAEKANNLKMMMKGLRVEYKADKSYILEIFGGEELGTWAYKDNHLNFTSETKKTSKNKITNITDSTYTFEMEGIQGAVITLQKVHEYTIPEKWVPTEHVLIEVKSKKFKGLWYLKEIVPSGNPEAAAAELMAGALFKDTYIHFQKGGEYEDNTAFKMIVRGNWFLSENKTTVTVNKGDSSIEYGFLTLTDDELTIVNMDKKMVLVYSRTELTPEEE